MSKIKSHVAISLDGYIARRTRKRNIGDTHQSSEILLAGFNTYSAIFEQCAGSWPYKNTYIVSHYDSSSLASENLQYLFNERIDKICEMKKRATGDITVIGGGNLITSLINNGLLDELHLYIIPVLLGDGIRFLGKTYDANIKSLKSEEYKGTTKICYTFS